MKSALLVVLLAAATTAAVVSNEEPDMVEVPDVDEVADVDMDEIPEVFVTDVDELSDTAEKPLQTVIVTCENLNLGDITSEDTRVINGELKHTSPHFHVREIGFRTRRPISAIRMNCVGDSQSATISIIGGGIGNYFVTIRIQSAGHGYHYRVEIYVR